MNIALNSTLGFLMAILLVIPGQSSGQDRQYAAVGKAAPKKAKMRILTVVDGEESVVEREIDLNQQQNNPIGVYNHNATAYIGEGTDVTIFTGPDGTDAISVVIGPAVQTVPKDDQVIVVEAHAALDDAADTDALDPALTEQLDALDLSQRDKNAIAALAARNNASLTSTDAQHRTIVWEQQGEEAVLELLATMDIELEGPNNLVYKAVVMQPSKQEAAPTLELETADARPLAVRSFEVFPNPTAGAFTVSLEPKGKQAVEVLVTDLNGKQLRKQKWFGQATYQASFDLTGEAAGLYLITVRQGKKTLTRKLLLE